MTAMTDAPPPAFPPTREEALARIDAIRPAEYARTRNSLEGAATRLSPYITHGIVGMPELLDRVASRVRLEVPHKLVFELGWREYFRHVWRHRGEDILRSLHPGPLPDSAYADTLPADLLHACTGVPVIDQAVRTLYTTGYLHNHARMWLASYAVHLRKVHWRAGADWMIAHLLDGDLASNHLSWQWVAGTASARPYLFNAENVARHAPASWHSPGSVLDTSYEALEVLARGPRAVPAHPSGDGLAPPPVSGVPPEATAPRRTEIARRDVWLVHPWSLGDPPPDLPSGTVCLGWWPAGHHADRPWSAARWAFAGTRMAALANLRWHATREELAQALSCARSVRTLADPHVAVHLPAGVQTLPPPALFPDLDLACGSFSAWWSRSTRGARCLDDLPGLAAWRTGRADRSADPPARAGDRAAGG